MFKIVISQYESTQHENQQKNDKLEAELVKIKKNLQIIEKKITSKPEFKE